MREMIVFMVAALSCAADAEPAKLRVLTYNVEFNNPTPNKSLDAIAAADADVVLLQEVDADWKTALDARFAKQYPHRAFHVEARGAAGSAVLSKLPISSDELVQPPRGGWFAPEHVVASPFGALQILNVHLRPALDHGNWVLGYFTTREVRAREAAAYWPQLRGSLPTLIAGDFNEPTDGRAVAEFSAHGFTIVDAAGPPTWHQDPLHLDLDRVMVDTRLVGSDGHVLDAGTSDHRRVIVTISPAR